MWSVDSRSSELHQPPPVGIFCGHNICYFDHFYSELEAGSRHMTILMKTSHFLPGFSWNKLRWNKRIVYLLGKELQLVLRYCIYKWINFGSAGFNTAITRFRVTIAMDCRGLTRFTNGSYVLGHEGRRSILFRYIVSILWISIFWRECSILLKETVYDWLFLRVIRGRRCYSSSSRYF
jgi:hypothetical protein